jgi:hypothetical protein
MIVGAMRLHDFDVMPEYIIQSLAQHCDKLVFLLHHVQSKRILEAVQNHPKTTLVKNYEYKWSQPLTLAALVELALKHKPEIILLPDEDEVFPDRLTEEIAKWRQVWDQHPTMSFQFFHSWSSPDRIISENVARVGKHCKVVHNVPGLLNMYLGRYAGWCWPSLLYRQRKYHCHYPLRHLAYMTEELRTRRLSKVRPTTTTGWWQWYSRERETMPYDPDMTWKEWVTMVGPLRTQEEDNAIHAVAQ